MANPRHSMLCATGVNSVPPGSGIKTSGCIVSAQNISDPTEPETAVVRWRSSEELIAGFSDLLIPQLQNISPERFEKITASELSQKLDLRNPSDRRLIAEAVNQEWQIWEKNKAGYDPEQKGKLDILRSASVIAHYYNDNTLRQLRDVHEFKPEMIGNMIIFPKDWEERWMKKNPSAFKIEEVIFIFIHDIYLKIHSDNLARIGCVLTDCPGLFASRWDTEIARRAMFNADAILYLFDGSRTMKLSDLKALQFIRQNGMEYKLFYGCNMRSHTLADSRRILNSTVTMLKNNGFKVQDDEFTLFHALLALRSVQGERLINAGAKNCTPDDLKILRKVIMQQISILDIDDEAFAGMDADSLRFAVNQSGLNQLMDMAENMVIKKKAKSILIDNGSQMAANCLLEVEGALRNREENAYKKEEEFRRQVEMVEKELIKFREECIHIIDRLSEEGPDYILADDIWKKLESHKEELCEKTSKRIYIEVVTFKSVPMLLFKREKLKDKIMGIIKEEIAECFKAVINTWISEIKDGKNEIYNTQIVKRIKAVSMELKNIWNKSALPDMNLLAGINIPEFSGNLEFDNELIFQELEKSQIVDHVRYNAILAAGGLTGIFTATSGILVAIVVMITRILWMVVASVVVILVNIIIIFLTQGYIEEKLEQEIKDTLSPAFNTLFYEIRESVKKEFREFSANIRHLYQHVFAAAIDKPRTLFESRKKQAEADFRKSQNDREAIARDAKRIRQEQIQPLRISLEDFVSKVKESLQRCKN